MADLKIGIAGILHVEGYIKGKTSGLVNDKDDAGGLTIAGISYANWPSWPGFARAKELEFDDKKMASDEKLNKLIVDFYTVNFWNKIKGPNIKSQLIANTIIKAAVLEGIVPAIKRAQDMVSLPQTGKVSDELIQKIALLS